MKYKTIIETDEYKDFEFYEDGIGKFMVGKDAGATADGGWIPLYFTECEQEPCEDCISRQAGLDVISRIGLCKCSTKEVQAVDECLRAVEALPPVTPQPKTGHWIRCDVLQEFKCSECRVCFRDKSSYCPNCGARMEYEEYEH